MAFREFAAHQRDTEREDVAFSLGGERFECVPMHAPAATAAIFRFAGRKFTYPIIVGFVEAVLADGADRFGELLERRGGDAIDERDLEPLALWLVETYTGRPTQRPTDSPSGASTTGGTSTEPSDSPASAAAGSSG